MSDTTRPTSAGDTVAVPAQPDGRAPAQPPAVPDLTRPLHAVLHGRQEAALLAGVGEQTRREADRAAAQSGLSVLPADGGGRLVVRGELDLATAEPLCDAVRAADSRPAGPVRPWLRLDLTGVTFLDSSGVQALNDVQARLALRGAHLRVLSPVARGPRWVLRYAASAGWLAPGLRPDEPEYPPPEPA